MNSIQRKQVGGWLLLGVGMILIQVMLGGVTRLTGSGLSITEWNVIMGTVPPLNESRWQEAFDKYKQFPQYRLMNSNMDISGFKKIFWWEFIHRLWGRLLAPVFLIPLAYFLWKKMIDKKLLTKLLIAFVLGGLQGLMGWIMVSSGLIDQPWVSPISLSIHLILALVLLCYLFWISLEVLQPESEPHSLADLKPFLIWILVLLGLQIFYGGLMAGNHAALYYPTFPKFGERWIPEALFVLTPRISNFFQNVGMIQLIHRTLGLLVAALIILFFYRARRKSGTPLFHRSNAAFPFLVLVQASLGILTLINSLGKIPIVPAAAHQFVATLLLITCMILLFQVSHTKKEESKTAEVSGSLASQTKD